MICILIARVWLNCWVRVNDLIHDGHSEHPIGKAKIAQYEGVYNYRGRFLALKKIHTRQYRRRTYNCGRAMSASGRRMERWEMHSFWWCMEWYRVLKSTSRENRSEDGFCDDKPMKKIGLTMAVIWRTSANIQILYPIWYHFFRIPNTVRF